MRHPACLVCCVLVLGFILSGCGSSLRVRLVAQLRRRRWFGWFRRDCHFWRYGYRRWYGYGRRHRRWYGHRRGTGTAGARAQVAPAARVGPEGLEVLETVWFAFRDREVIRSPGSDRVNPVASSSRPVQGLVNGGQSRAVVGAKVYVLQANTTGYGKPSVSLLTSGTATQADSIGYYALTGEYGGFSIAGDYTCTAGRQVYLYVLGGNSGGNGPNSAIGLIALSGACPESRNLHHCRAFRLRQRSNDCCGGLRDGWNCYRPDPRFRFRDSWGFDWHGQRCHTGRRRYGIRQRQAGQQSSPGKDPHFRQYPGRLH